MNAPVSSKLRLAITGQDELIREAGIFLPTDPDIRFDFGPQPVVELGFRRKTFRFLPHYALDPANEDVRNLGRSRGAGEHVLLITAYLSPRLLQACREHEVSAVDLNGRIYLIRNDLLVDRVAREGRHVRVANTVNNIFIGKSLSIIKVLLTDRDKAWKQSEVVAATKASGGLVSRVVNHLVHQGYVARQDDRTLVVRDHLALIEDWRTRDRLAERTRIRRYSELSSLPVARAQSLCSSVAKEGIPIALTQWVAAWLRHPYTQPVICSAYVARFPSDESLGRIGLRPVAEAGNVFLYQAEEGDPVWQGVRKIRDHAGQPVDSLPVVSDAQIVVDLHRAGLRADEQVDALCKWEGFCRA